MAQRRIIELFERDPAGSHLYNRILAEAAIKDRLITACGQTVHLKRGQLVFGRSQWASKTGLTEAVIRRILKQLEDEREISQLKLVKFTVISVLSIMPAPGDSQDTANDQPGGGHSKNKEQQKKEGTDKDFGVFAKQPGAKKGSRWIEGESVPSDWKNWALEQGIAKQVIANEAEKFVDYWISTPGQKGVKANWFATWKNWMRKVKEQGRGVAQAGKQQHVGGLAYNKDLAREEHHKNLLQGGNW
ncbi:hypothetical protein ACK3YY_07105 [Aeromonas caviae]